MDSIHPQSHTEASARVTLLSPTAVEAVFEGHITRGMFAAALDEIDALMAANPKAQSVLWNVTGLTGYDAANTAMTMKWFARQVQVRRSALVTRSQAVASLIHITRVMVPGVDAQAFRLGVEAKEWLATPLTGRGRARSGRHKAA